MTGGGSVALGWLEIMVSLVDKYVALDVRFVKMVQKIKPNKCSWPRSSILHVYIMHEGTANFRLPPNQQKWGNEYQLSCVPWTVVRHYIKG